MWGGGRGEVDQEGMGKEGEKGRKEERNGGRVKGEDGLNERETYKCSLSCFLGKSLTYIRRFFLLISGLEKFSAHEVTGACRGNMESCSTDTCASKDLFRYSKESKHLHAHTLENFRDHLSAGCQ